MKDLWQPIRFDREMLLKYDRPMCFDAYLGKTMVRYSRTV
jgi:hypothetical protein